MKNLFSALLLLSFVTVRAQQTATTPPPPPTPSVDFNEFITESVKKGGEGLHQQIAMWMPDFFWEQVMHRMNIAESTVDLIRHEMGNYMMFFVVDYTVQEGGAMSFASEDDIRKTIKLVDASKNIALPLDNDKLSDVAKAMMSGMVPTMQKMFGQFGQGMHIFLFDGKGANGQPAYDPMKPGSFMLIWEGAHLKWALPFSCMMPAKYCPVDHEKMQGNWNYCPVHGAKL